MTVASSESSLNAPQYTLCPAPRNAACSLGSLPADQAFEVAVADHVRTSAAPGAPATLTVTVTGAGLSPAEAAITTAVGQPSASPSPTATVTLPPSSTYYPTLPSTTVTPGPLTSLFPVVTPSPSASTGPSAAGRHRQDHHLAGVTSSALPLDPRMIGGQLAGLAVLAAAITMVVARLSLRTPQPAAGPAATAQSSDLAITQTTAPAPAPQAGAATATAGTPSPDDPQAGAATATTGTPSPDDPPPAKPTA